MKFRLAVCVAIAAASLPTVAAADDPNDPTMSNSAARARDRAIIRQLNLQELARVRERDARYAAGWRAAGAASNPVARDPDYSRRADTYERARADYHRDRGDYERDLAQWRRAVAACRAGDYSACDG